MIHPEEFARAFSYCDKHGIVVVGYALPNKIDTVGIKITINGRTRTSAHTYTNKTVGPKIQELYIELYQRAIKQNS